MRSIPTSLAVLTLAGACGISQDTTERIDVVGPSVSNVATVLVERFEERGDRVFELRGLDADEHEVAGVRLRIGEISDLPHFLPTADTFGSELVLDMGSFEQRSLSHEITIQTVFPVRDAAMQAFLELELVSSTLRAENIHVIPGQRAAEHAYWATAECPSTYLNQTPLASQCCFAERYNQGTVFINPSGQDVHRVGPMTPCSSYSGGSCAGLNCYFGPNGFARPVVNAASWFNVNSEGGNCDVGYGNVEFSDIPGSFPNGQVCPGGNTGNAAWDY